MKRFYKDVTVAPHGPAFSVLLDGKPIKTPARAALAVPTRALAEAIAEEWRGQGETISPETMLLTKLANTAIDRVPAQRDAIVEATLGFARSDLLCYRAETPDALIARQREQWDPLLDWLEQRHGAPLAIGSGIHFVTQSDDALAALARAVRSHDDFQLAGLQNAASILGSLGLSLALADARLSAQDAFAAATLDETFQAEQWGRDEAAESRREHLAAELAGTERFMRLLRA
ncbi:MAG TPA: ATP12 family protein [Rhizomicrobium sp.]|jgi:chaperone required for assembly of F1-ATPase|nr:ATP12 family protein [Rhizomicrobium sp.]